MDKRSGEARRPAKKPRARAPDDGKLRLTVLMAVCAAAFALFAARLAWLQFARADFYAAKAASAANTGYTVPIAAARGDITDRAGILLAGDDLRYDVYLRIPAPPGQNAQATLARLQSAMQGQGWAAPSQDGKNDGRDVAAHLAAFLSSGTAGECLAAQSLTPAQANALAVAGFTPAAGVRLAARGVRCWPQGSLLAQQLGTVGAITAEEWAADGGALAKAGYRLSDRCGQSGLEAAFEADLRGREGEGRVTLGRDGAGFCQTDAVLPRPGLTLRLTVDAGLQQILQAALAERLAALQALGGAAVAVDTATGGILAAVSLPGYDPAGYAAGYAALAADAAAPLFDRVCRGLYAPGSAFKPAVAAAALAAGLITPATPVNCTGTYRYYADYQPRCLQAGHRGPVDLTAALAHSCNLYFYDVGRRLGVDAFAATASLLGLAAPTGAELPQAAGRLTRSSDANYTPGLALQAAIGQGNTAVTPLQLAACAAALANNGARPRLHFADALLDPATGAVVRRCLPGPAAAAPGGEAVFGPLRAGMAAMAATLPALRDAPLPAACKTGSPQRAETAPDGAPCTNAVLIGYAPVDAPQVAVAVVLEYGGGGSNAAPVFRAVVNWIAENSLQ